MALTDSIRFARAAGLKVFNRVRRFDGTSVYVNVSALDSPSIVRDELRIRTTNKPIPSKGKANEGSRTHNTNREMEVKGADGLIYKLTANLTITAPHGNVITGAAMGDMIQDLVAFASDFDGCNTAEGSDYGSISGSYMTSVRSLEA